MLYHLIFYFLIHPTHLRLRANWEFCFLIRIWKENWFLFLGVFSNFHRTLCCRYWCNERSTFNGVSLIFTEISFGSYLGGSKLGGSSLLINWYSFLVPTHLIDLHWCFLTCFGPLGNVQQDALSQNKLYNGKKLFHKPTFVSKSSFLLSILYFAGNPLLKSISTHIWAYVVVL